MYLMFEVDRSVPDCAVVVCNGRYKRGLHQNSKIEGQGAGEKVRQSVQYRAVIQIQIQIKRITAIRLGQIASLMPHS